MFGGILFSRDLLSLAVRQVVDSILFERMPIKRFTFCSLRGISRWGMEEIMISFVQAEEKMQA